MINNIPNTYDELEKDELLLLLYYLKICMNNTDDVLQLNIYQKKIDYINSLLNNK